LRSPLPSQKDGYSKVGETYPRTVLSSSEGAGATLFRLQVGGQAAHGDRGAAKQVAATAYGAVRGS
jgi:hypothetical protein